MDRGENVILRRDSEREVITDSELDITVNDIGRARLSDRIDVSDLRDRGGYEMEHQHRALFEENGIGKCLLLRAEI